MEKRSPVEREFLVGLVERVTFHNEQNGFCVLRVKVKGKRDLITAVGHAAVITAGEFVQMSGNWFNDRAHGLQFQAVFMKSSPPTTLDGIEKYLASGMVKGIGPVYAKKMVQAFGSNVFDVIEGSPDRLREVAGIGRKRADRISEGWAAQRIIREIMVFLHANGVGTARAVRIYKTYGADAVQLISENPYRLATDIRGIGFRTADAVAMKLEIDKTATVRTRAGISFALTQALGEGHCGLPTDDLVTLTSELLEVPHQLIESALKLELQAGSVIADTIEDKPCVFLSGLYRAEQSIASRIRLLRSGRLPWSGIDVEKALPWVQDLTGLTLAPSQVSALDAVLHSKLVVLTGGPGVGKTTLVNSILRILAVRKVKLLLCAPTGRAAKRMTEATAMDAKTIHRLLEVDPSNGGFRRTDDNPLECELLVVDETSMVDVPLMNALLRAVPSTAAVLFVGDVDQLPPVGPGQPFADIISSGAIPVVHLTEVFRQAAESQIIQTAHRVNAGRLPDFSVREAESDLHFVQADDAETVVRKLIKIVKERVPTRFGMDALKDIQVLCPMNRGAMGARCLNIELQSALNPRMEPFVEKFGTRFLVGDKVMQVENDYDKEVYNGDIGIVESISTEMEELAINFDGRSIDFQFGELDQVVLAYATTIHKSQGSEYPAVIIPVTMQHYTMLKRNLLYTGITRGKRLVVLIGQKRAVAMAVKNIASRRRWSKLGSWLSRDSAMQCTDVVEVHQTLP